MARSFTLRKVTNEYGLPLIGIMCEGINATTGAVAETKWTDANGEAAFTALPDAGTIVHIKIYRAPFLVEWREDIFLEASPISADHGGLTGLADDDHTQYIKVDGTRAFTGNQSLGNKTLTNVLSIDFTDFAELTIATGAITVTQGCHTVDTAADAASDDLDTINGGTAGMVIFLRAESDVRTIVVKHNTGNIWLQGKNDVPLDDIRDAIFLVYDGTKWCDIAAGSTPGGTGGIDKGVLFPDTANAGDVFFRTDTVKLYLCDASY